MVDNSIVLTQLPFCLTETHLDFLGKRYAGKVRDSYSRDGKRYLITTDRLSCFDVIVTSVPFKGQVLTQLALYWFKKAASIIPVHVLDNPDPNVIVGVEASVVPIEVVVRGYLTGSAWRDYEAGKPVSGITLPKGMKKSQRFDTPLLTPSTKAEKGSHDMPIGEAEIVSQGIVAASVWNEIRTAALKLFAMGSEEVAKRGLLLVDTKYEFGIKDGKVMLVDEMHTLDSSRFWDASEYQARFEAGEDQVMLDKEPTRQWLISQGFMGEGVVPQFTDEHRVSIAQHYIQSYERITGVPFEPVSGDPILRITERLTSSVSKA